MKRKFISLMMCTALVLGIAVPTFADTFNYTPINGPAADADDGFEFEKDLVIPADAEVPEATFSYSVAPGAAVDAGTGTAKVLAGVGTPTIEDVEYAAGETASADMTLTTEGENKIATKKAQVDFSACEFTEPGIYRYIVTESGDNQGITNDPILTRTLDVYVEDYKDYYDTLTDKTGYAEPDGKQLFIANYVLYEGKQDTAPSASAETADGKSTGYTNAYASYDLTFSKTVTGNQGSKDKYFAFTLEISNAVEGTVYDVSYTADDDEFTKDGNADVKISANPNHATTCIATDVEQPASLKVEENGTVKQVFYLQHGQSIAVRGLAEGTKYTITEEAEDYTPTVDVNNEKAIVSGTVVSSDTAGIHADTIVQYTNDRSGVIPTGVLSTVAGSAGLVAVGILGIAGGALYLKKKKSEEA